ncbi:MAG: 16S rRNA (uracil(1498)-N(3))-methyltransferase [Lewinella sp.]|nr:16S rRNA (uracil(1498)-N(3))-methyltransferase [Lewinella sp.]
MQLFYVPQLETGILELPSEEARHAVQVLRRRMGDVLDLVDGRGGWFKGTILEAEKRRCTLEVALFRREPQRRAYQLTMAVAPTKNNDRYEWFLEKATEIGVDRIVPLYCAHAERTKVRLDRWEKVLVAAMKQSLQAWLPVLTEPVPFTEFSVHGSGSAQRYIGWCDESVETVLADNYQAGRDVCIMIGPEGDFSAPEVELARQHGWQPMTLGPNRLRTETAAVVAVHTVALVNGG